MKDEKLKKQLIQLWSAFVVSAIKAKLQDRILPLSHCAYLFGVLTGLRATALNDFMPGLSIPEGTPATSAAKNHLDDLSEEEKLLLSAALEAAETEPGKYSFL